MGNGNLAGTGAIWGTYPADKGAAVFTIEYKCITSRMTVLDGAAHHEGGQRAAVVHRPDEAGVLHCQSFDAACRVAEERLACRCELQVLYLLAIAQVGAAEARSHAAADGNPLLTLHVDVHRLPEASARAVGGNGSVRVHIVPAAVISEALPIVDTVGQRNQRLLARYRIRVLPCTVRTLRLCALHQRCHH